MADPLLPCPIKGTITKGTTPLANRKVVITNNSTGDTVSIVTDSDGRYLYDAANFPNDYSYGDEITVSVDNETAKFKVEVRTVKDNFVIRKRRSMPTRELFPFIETTNFAISDQLEFLIVESNTDGEFKLKVIYEG